MVTEMSLRHVKQTSASSSTYLPYEVQVAELRKIHKLSPPVDQSTQESPPHLVCVTENRNRAACTVCGRTSNETITIKSCSKCRKVDYCCEEHQALDRKWHQHVCAQFSTIAEDEELLRTKTFTELAEDFVMQQDAAVFSREHVDWESFLSQPTESLSSSARCRILTSLLSRPLTIVYAIQRLRLLESRDNSDSILICVVGASKRELEVPQRLYEQITSFWPNVRFEIVFVGPELDVVPDQQQRHSDNLRLSFQRSTFTRNQWLARKLPDLICGFNCGLVRYKTWGETVLEILQMDRPFVTTSYRNWEQQAEAKVLEAVGAKFILKQQENPFHSLVFRQSTTIVNDVCQDNAFVMAVRGKR